MGELTATIQGGTATYHLRDHLSVRVNADANGNKIGEQGHYPYGESWYSSGTTTKWQFTNYERDAESGNDYAIARFYVNRLGRFYSPDPVDGNPTSPQTLDLYAYVTDEPIDFIDPDGRINSPTCGAGGGDPGNPFGTPPFFPGGGFPWPIWWPGGGGSVGPTPPFFSDVGVFSLTGGLAYIGVRIARTNLIFNGVEGSNCIYYEYCPNGNTAASCPVSRATVPGNYRTCLNYLWSFFLVVNGRCFPVAISAQSNIPISCN